MIWPKSLCIIWVTFILVHEVSCRYSLREICSQRCLYGRGGILCHCNAMHFTGKRSGSDHNSIDSRVWRKINIGRGDSSGDNLRTLRTVSMDGDFGGDEDDIGDAGYDFLLRKLPTTHVYRSKSQHRDNENGRNDPLNLLSDICAYSCRNGKGSSLCHCSELHSKMKRGGYDRNSIDSKIHLKFNDGSGGGGGGGSGHGDSRKPRQSAGHTISRLSRAYDPLDDDDDVDALLLEYSVNNELQNQNQKQQQKQNDNSDSSGSSSKSVSSSLLSSPSSSLPFASLSSSSTRSLSPSLPGFEMLADLPQDVQARLMGGHGDVSGDDARYNIPYLQSPGHHSSSRDLGKGQWLEDTWLQELCASLCQNGMGGYACDCVDQNTKQQGPRNGRGANEDSQYGRYNGGNGIGTSEQMMVDDGFIENDKSMNGVDDDVDAEAESVSLNSAAAGGSSSHGGDSVVKNRILFPTKRRSESEDIHERMGDMINRLSTLHIGALRRHQRHAIREFNSHSDVATTNNNINNGNGVKINDQNDRDDGETAKKIKDSKINPQAPKLQEDYNNDSSRNNNSDS